MKVMLIDDSKTMRTIQKNVLAQMGYTDICEAADGQDALSKVFAEQPGIILLDWNMPNMNGLEFLQKYRQQEKNTPVIMCTTEAEKPRVIEALKNGANNYVVKPFTPDGLAEKINQTLKKVTA